MKKVIFLCLLSLSVCLSKPAENQAASNPPPANPPQNAVIPTQPAIVAADTKPASAKEQTPTSTEKIAPPPATAKNETATVVTPTKDSTPPKETPKPADDNNTQNKGGEQKPKEGAVSATNDTKVVTEKITTDKPTEGTAKGNVTKPEEVPPKPTETPKPSEAPKSDKDAHIVQSGGFSGTSFMGGIILTLGLLAIGFMGFKYYKNQTERNYHTL